MGFRTARMMLKSGVHEDDFNQFMNEVYAKCELLEISPDEITLYLNELVKMSKIVFPSQIPDYLEKKREEIQKIEQQLKEKNQNLISLNDETTAAENRLNKTLENENISSETIEWNYRTKKELENNGIPVNELDLFIQCVKGIKNLNYDVRKVLAKYSEYEYFVDLIESQKHIHEKMKKDIAAAEFQLAQLNPRINDKRLKLSKIFQLEKMGFGLEQLRYLHNTIKEIAKENDIGTDTAVEKFFNDLDDYEEIAGFQNKLKQQREESNKLNIQIATARSILLAHQYIGPVLQNLLAKGITENDIININAILSLIEPDYFNRNLHKQQLIEDLENYKNLKKLIQSLEQHKINLEKNNFILENHKQQLENFINLYLLFLLSFLGDIKSSLNRKLHFENLHQIFLVCILNLAKDAKFSSSDEKKEDREDRENENDHSENDNHRKRNEGKSK
ncbi:MAG TPA: hypothetical protein VJ767_05905 [Nitrososphaeraceae archaeon]|nr:hypothetical protein [Nitrososphaeraceae archaeon]